MQEMNFPAVLPICCSEAVPLGTGLALAYETHYSGVALRLREIPPRRLGVGCYLQRPPPVMSPLVLLLGPAPTLPHFLLMAKPIHLLPETVGWDGCLGKHSGGNGSPSSVPPLSGRGDVSP